VSPGVNAAASGQDTLDADTGVLLPLQAREMIEPEEGLGAGKCCRRFVSILWSLAVNEESSVMLRKLLLLIFLTIVSNKTQQLEAPGTIFHEQHASTVGEKTRSRLTALAEKAQGHWCVDSENYARFHQCISISYRSARLLDRVEIDPVQMVYSKTPVSP